MKKLRSTFAILLACLLCLGCACAESGIYRLGDAIEDFTVTTFDGKTFTLSEALAEKDMVMINIWASWCGPCCNEFPHIEEAYQQFKDRVEIIALSCEPSDTPDVLTEFVASMGLSFPVGQDTLAISNRFGVSTIPTSIVVDRFGTICYIGSTFPDVQSVVNLFDFFAGDDYTESRLLTGIPPKKPDIEPSAGTDIAAALGTDAAVNPTDTYTWPMPVTEKDGRSVVASPNAALATSLSSVTVPVSARAGDAIAVTFKTSTEPAVDVLAIRVNGEQVKLFSGEHDWTTYAIPVAADGSFDVELSYTKDIAVDMGEDTVWIDSVTVLSGDEAAAALAANPAYPVGEAFSLTVTDEAAREIHFPEDDESVRQSFGESKYYIVNGDTAAVSATLTADIDPEGAFFYSYYTGSIIPMTECMTDDGYVFNAAVDTLESRGIPFSLIMVGMNASGSGSDAVFLFRDEENVDSFIRTMGLRSWAYADEAAALPEAAAALIDGEAAYTIRCVDQDGAPVEGVMIQICDAASCRVGQSDAEGLHTFTSAPCAWEIHVLAAPEGYTADGETVIAPANGGEITLTLKKN